MESKTTNAKETMKQPKRYEKKEPYTDEEIYGLWWKYLKLSGSYKDFCEIMRSVTDTETENFYRQVDEGYKKKYPESQQLFDYDYYFNHLSNWEFMGDVHANSFDEWWKSWKIPEKKSYSIINLRDHDIRRRLPRYQFALRMHNKRQEKPPTPEEVTKYLTTSMEYIFIAIPLSDELKTGQISKTISQMRKTAREKYINIEMLNEYRFRIPYGTIRYKELWDYHKVYHSINVDGLDRKEAKRKTGILDSSAFSKHFNNAMVIIKKVEQGIFPGTEYWGKSFLKTV